MSGKKILIIRYKPLKYFIQCISAFAAIRNFHKDDEITILTEKSLVKFCKRSRLFDKVWLDAMPDWFEVPGVIDIIKRLRAGKFDVVYDLQNDKRSEWYFRLTGFRKPKWSSMVVKWCSYYYQPESYDVHYQELVNGQVKAAGIKAVPQIDISYMASNDGTNDLPERFVMICSGGDKEKAPLKWDPVKYAEMIDSLFEKHGLQSVLVGDGGDDFWINNLVAQQCIKAKPINYSGKTSINGIIDMAKRAVFCIGNETSPTHIAAYSGCKTIMICSRFSPSELIAPKVKNLVLIEEPMLEDVTTERVLKVIEEVALVDMDGKDFKIASQEELTMPEFLSNKS